MDINSTRFLCFCQIDTSMTDLFSDAFGYDQCLEDLLPDFDVVEQKPVDKLVGKLIDEADRISG